MMELVLMKLSVWQIITLLINNLSTFCRKIHSYGCGLIDFFDRALKFYVTYGVQYLPL